MDIALSELGENDFCKTKQFCDHVIGHIRELSILQDGFINIDELNYLAKRINSFDKKEINQFKAAMQITNAAEIKDMINLTFNLHNYTLITDFSDMEKVGRTHRLNVEGCISIDDSYDYRALGESLLNSGKGIATAYSCSLNGVYRSEKAIASPTKATVKSAMRERILCRMKFS